MVTPGSQSEAPENEVCRPVGLFASCKLQVQHVNNTCSLLRLVAWLGWAWRGVAWRGVEGTWYNIADCSFIFVISFPDSIACYRLNYIDYTVGTMAKLKLQNFLNVSVSAFCVVVFILQQATESTLIRCAYFHSVVVVVLGSSLHRVSDSDDFLQYT